MDGQLAELAACLDFTERLLAERRREQLGAGVVTARDDREERHGDL